MNSSQPLSSYFAYGLKINSEMPIPEFITDNGQEQADVWIRAEPVNRDRADLNGFERFDRQEAVLYVEKVGRIVIREGREILLSPNPRIDWDLARLLLIGIVMATLLYQRGCIVMHASVVEIDGRAIAFAGVPGQGQSTLAAAFFASGHRLVADDVAAIHLEDGQARVMPSFPRIKVNPSTAEVLGLSDASTNISYGHYRKDGLCVRRDFTLSPKALHAIYLLQPAADCSFTLMNKQAALIQLLIHTLPTQIMQPGDARQLSQIADLIKDVPVYAFKRRFDITALESQVQLVKQHLSMSFEGSLSSG